MTPEDREWFASLLAKHDEPAKKFAETARYSKPSGVNWGGWLMGIVAAVILGVAAYSASTFLGHSDRITKVETTTEALTTKVEKIETKVDAGFEKTNEKLNVLIGRQAAANGGRR